MIMFHCLSVFYFSVDMFYIVYILIELLALGFSTSTIFLGTYMLWKNHYS